LLAAREIELGLCLGNSRLGGIEVARQRHLLATDHATPRGQVAVVEHGQFLTALDRIADIGAKLPDRCGEARGNGHRHPRLQGAGPHDALAHLALHRFDGRYCDGAPKAHVGQAGR
jgi:hypothetical protein